LLCMLSDSYLRELHSFPTRRSSDLGGRRHDDQIQTHGLGSFDAYVRRQHLGLAIRKHNAHFSGADRLIHILFANATQRSKTLAKNTNLLSSDPARRLGSPGTSSFKTKKDCQAALDLQSSTNGPPTWGLTRFRLSAI